MTNISICDKMTYINSKDGEFMADMGTKEASKKWGVSQQTVQIWCRTGKIKGATQDKIGSPWHIPKNAEKPTNKQ